MDSRLSTLITFNATNCYLVKCVAILLLVVITASPSNTFSLPFRVSEPANSDNRQPSIYSPDSQHQNISGPRPQHHADGLHDNSSDENDTDVLTINNHQEKRAPAQLTKIKSESPALLPTDNTSQQIPMASQLQSTPQKEKKDFIDFEQEAAEFKSKHGAIFTTGTLSSSLEGQETSQKKPVITTYKTDIIRKELDTHPKFLTLEQRIASWLLQQKTEEGFVSNELAKDLNNSDEDVTAISQKDSSTDGVDVHSKMLQNKIKEKRTDRTASADKQTAQKHKEQETAITNKQTAQEQKTDSPNKHTSQEKKEQKIVSHNKQTAEEQKTDITNKQIAQEQKTTITNKQTAQEQKTDITNKQTAYQQKTDITNKQTAYQQKTDITNKQTAHEQKTDITNKQTAQEQKTDITNKQTAYQQKTDITNKQTAYQQKTDITNKQTAQEQKTDITNKQTAHEQKTDITNKQTAHEQKTDITNKQTAHQQKTEITNKQTAQEQKTDITNKQTAQEQKTDITNKQTAHQQKIDIPIKQTAQEQKTDITNKQTAYQQKTDITNKQAAHEQKTDIPNKQTTQDKQSELSDSDTSFSRAQTPTKNSEHNQNSNKESLLDRSSVPKFNLFDEIKQQKSTSDIIKQEQIQTFDNGDKNIRNSKDKEKAYDYYYDFERPPLSRSLRPHNDDYDKAYSSDDAFFYNEDKEKSKDILKTKQERKLSREREVVHETGSFRTVENFVDQNYAGQEFAKRKPKTSAMNIKDVDRVVSVSAFKARVARPDDEKDALTKPVPDVSQSPYPTTKSMLRNNVMHPINNGHVKLPTQMADTHGPKQEVNHAGKDTNFGITSHSKTEDKKVHTDKYVGGTSDGDRLSGVSVSRKSDTDAELADKLYRQRNLRMDDRKVQKEDLFKDYVEMDEVVKVKGSIQGPRDKSLPAPDKAALPVLEVSSSASDASNSVLDVQTRTHNQPNSTREISAFINVLPASVHDVPSSIHVLPDSVRNVGLPASKRDALALPHNVQPTSAGDVPATSARDVPATSARDIPATSARDVPATSARNVPATSARNVPATSAGDVPATSARDVPATSARDVPATSTRNVPATSARDVPATSARNVPATSARNVPATSAGDVPATSARNVPATSARDVPATSAPASPKIPASPVRHLEEASNILTSARNSIPSFLQESSLLDNVSLTPGNMTLLAGEDRLLNTTDVGDDVARPEAYLTSWASAAKVHNESKVDTLPVSPVVLPSTKYEDAKDVHGQRGSRAGDIRAHNRNSADESSKSTKTDRNSTADSVEQKMPHPSHINITDQQNATRIVYNKTNNSNINPYIKNTIGGDVNSIKSSFDNESVKNINSTSTEGNVNPNLLENTARASSTRISRTETQNYKKILEQAPLFNDSRNIMEDGNNFTFTGIALPAQNSTNVTEFGSNNRPLDEHNVLPANGTVRYHEQDISPQLNLSMRPGGDLKETSSPQIKPSANNQNLSLSNTKMAETKIPTLYRSRLVSANSDDSHKHKDTSGLNNSISNTTPPGNPKESFPHLISGNILSNGSASHNVSAFTNISIGCDNVTCHNVIKIEPSTNQSAIRDRQRHVNQAVVNKGPVAVSNKETAVFNKESAMVNNKPVAVSTKGPVSVSKKEPTVSNKERILSTKISPARISESTVTNNSIFVNVPLHVNRLSQESQMIPLNKTSSERSYKTDSSLSVSSDDSPTFGNNTNRDSPFKSVILKTASTNNKNNVNGKTNMNTVSGGDNIVTRSNSTNSGQRNENFHVTTNNAEVNRARKLLSVAEADAHEHSTKMAPVQPGKQVPQNDTSSRNITLPAKSSVSKSNPTPHRKVSDIPNNDKSNPTPHMKMSDIPSNDTRASGQVHDLNATSKDKRAKSATNFIPMSVIQNGSRETNKTSSKVLSRANITRDYVLSASENMSLNMATLNHGRNTENGNEKLGSSPQSSSIVNRTMSVTGSRKLGENITSGTVSGNLDLQPEMMANEKERPQRLEGEPFDPELLIENVVTAENLTVNIDDQEEEDNNGGTTEGESSSKSSSSSSSSSNDEVSDDNDIGDHQLRSDQISSQGSDGSEKENNNKEKQTENSESDKKMKNVEDDKRIKHNENNKDSSNAEVDTQMETFDDDSRRKDSKDDTQSKNTEFDTKMKSNETDKHRKITENDSQNNDLADGHHIKNIDGDKNSKDNEVTATNREHKNKILYTSDVLRSQISNVVKAASDLGKSDNRMIEVHREEHQKVSGIGDLGHNDRKTSEEREKVASKEADINKMPNRNIQTNVTTDLSGANLTKNGTSDGSQQIDALHVNGSSSKANGGAQTKLQPKTDFSSGDGLHKMGDNTFKRHSSLVSADVNPKTPEISPYRAQDFSLLKPAQSKPSSNKDKSDNINISSSKPILSNSSRNSTKEDTQRDGGPSSDCGDFCFQGTGGFLPKAQAAVSAVLTTHFGPTRDQMVPFDLELLDLADNYDNTTGMFICTIPGTYVISLYLMSHPGAKVNARIFINNRPIAALWADDAKNAGFYPSSSTQTIAQLVFGDQVYVMLVDGGYGDSWVHANYNVFTVFLLYEQVF